MENERNTAEEMTPYEIIGYIDANLKGNVVPLDVEQVVIKMIETYADQFRKPSVISDELRAKMAATVLAGMFCENTFLDDPDTMAQNAVYHTDALIAELQKPRNDERAND